MHGLSDTHIEEWSLMSKFIHSLISNSTEIIPLDTWVLSFFSCTSAGSIAFGRDADGNVIFIMWIHFLSTYIYVQFIFMKNMFFVYKVLGSSISEKPPPVWGSAQNFIRLKIQNNHHEASTQSDFGVFYILKSFKPEHAWRPIPDHFGIGRLSVRRIFINVSLALGS